MTDKIDYSNILDDFEKRHQKEDEIHRYHDKLRHLMILEQLKLSPQDNVLDAGCGTGDLLLELASTGANITGIDVSSPNIKKSEVLIKEGKKNNVSLVIADINKLPFKENTFDKIVCTEVLEHLGEMEPALIELKRVLKDNGTIIITVPNLYHPWNFVPFELFPYKKCRFSILKFPSGLKHGFLNQGYVTPGGEKMEIHYYFTPNYFRNKINKYFTIIKYQSTLKWNNRIIYKIFPRIQEYIAKSWFGKTNFLFMKYLGINLVIVAMKKI